ncbi:hypothetical protein LCGC14_1390790, partial [marine sediment metagenome]
MTEASAQAPQELTKGDTVIVRNTTGVPARDIIEGTATLVHPLGIDSLGREEWELTFPGEDETLVRWIYPSDRVAPEALKLAGFPDEAPDGPGPLGSVYKAGEQVTVYRSRELEGVDGSEDVIEGEAVLVSLRARELWSGM